MGSVEVEIEVVKGYLRIALGDVAVYLTKQEVDQFILGILREYQSL